MHQFLTSMILIWRWRSS